MAQMKAKVIASTKVGYVLSKEEALDFSGKSAGICYLPDTLETLFSEPSEKTRLNPFQTIFVIYGLVYGSFWLKIDTVFDMLKVNVTFFIITSAVVLVLTPVTLVYNHKFESCKSNIICCNCIALFAVGCFVYRLINILLVV